MIRGFKTWMCALGVLAMTAAGQAQATSAAQALAQRLTINGEAVPVKTVKKTPLQGIYEIRLESGETLYSDAEGKHLFVGDLYANRGEGLVNLTQQARNDVRAERLQSIPQDERVVFRGKQAPKAVIQVFTDPTCPYCRKLHEEVPRLNAMGIEVQYLAFPRNGLSSEGARILAQVWCADNPSEALTAAKRGEALTNAPDCEPPIAEQYRLGLELEIQGTPGIVLPDGQLVPGYVPAERLAGMLGIDS